MMIDVLMKSTLLPFALAGVAAGSVAAQSAGAQVAQAAQEEFPSPSDFSPGYRDIGGVKLHYVKGGKGPRWYSWSMGSVRPGMSGGP